MSTPWWHPGTHQDRRAGLVLRANLARAIRSWFWDQGFIEVEPDNLQISPGNETHVHGLKTQVQQGAAGAIARYLHTSPEFAMKKLLAAGEEKIFALPRVYRNREDSPLHLIEFTMLEWYRRELSYQDIMADCTALLTLAAKVRGDGRVCYRGKTCDLQAEPQHVTVQDAFQRHAGVDLLATLQSDPNHGNPRALANASTHLDIKFSDDETWSDMFSKILTTYVEPNLGLDQPTFLFDYPLPEAALARPVPDQPQLGERFELYCCGVELANGFGELTDAVEQRRRFHAAMDEKQKIYGERYPIDDDFLSALDRMPDAAGVALGFDRLALLVAGADRLDQVVWTPAAATHSGE